VNIVEIIARKRDGHKLSRDEISGFVRAFLEGSVRDYQMSAFLMAIYLNGMDFEETAALTETMLRSGDVVSFDESDMLYVDKHSTGGVGDKVSLILTPLVAACGARVPMLSGRGLGHTGGTLDKLESIPGFRTDLSIDEFVRGVERVGCIISGQTAEMAPADRLMYALRDVTATVESVPLICSSILSKKLAAGPGGLVFDVKCGNGAFMKDLESARLLARNLLAVAKSMGKRARALVTDMNQPLGGSAGNILEVIESIDALRGRWSPDLRDITMELGAEMLLMAGISSDLEKSANLLKYKLDDGSAYRKFEEMVTYQGGDLAVFAESSDVPRAAYIREYKAPIDGYLWGFKTAEIGRLIAEMGGGRKMVGDRIDHLVGLKFSSKIGDEIARGDIIAEIHAKDKGQATMASARLAKLIEIGSDRPRSDFPLIIERLD
jgi:pyrimidine-nucleoside phosphorylase